MPVSNFPGVLEKAESLLLQLGFTPVDAFVYLALIADGPRTRTNLAKALRHLEPTQIDTAIDRLKALHLVAEQHTKASIRIAPTRPRISWRYQVMELVWRHTTTEPIERIEAIPPLTNSGAQQRRRLLESLAKLLDPLVPPLAFRPFGARQGRSFSDASDYAYACAEAISMAEGRIVSCEKPPRMPHLSIFWAAITDRLDYKVEYTRCVSLNEVLAHGIEIVRRDVELLGIDLRIAPAAAISKSFYLIDDKYLLAKTAEAGKFGFMSFNSELIERYRQKHAHPVLARSTRAPEILHKLCTWLDEKSRAVEAELGVDAVDTFKRIAKRGQFAELTTAQRTAVQRLLDRRLVVANQEGNFTLATPDDAFLRSLV